MDSSHAAYITGGTYSTDYPVVGSFGLNRNSGGCDSFVAKLEAGGNLVKSGYFGSGYDDWANAIAVDASGTVYLTGAMVSRATDSPPNTPNAFITTIGSTTISMRRFYQRGGPSWGVAIWADTVHTYVAGVVGPNASFSTTLGAFQTARPNPTGFDTFVYVESSTGVYSTYLGGSNGSTMPTAIAVISGHVYVAGNTSSSAFPGAPALTPNPTAGWVSKLEPQLNALDYTTLLGASINGIALQQHTLR